MDRDSEQLAGLFDERDPAVSATIAEAIDKAHAAGIKIGICGQAPSDYPEFAAFLVEALPLRRLALLEFARQGEHPGDLGLGVVEGRVEARDLRQAGQPSARPSAMSILWSSSDTPYETTL